MSGPRRTALLPILAVLAVAAAVLAGCGGEPAEEGTTAPPRAAPAPAAPRAGACYVLDVAAALKATNSSAPVSCARRHNAVTVRVGTVDPIIDGHLLAIDSARIQSQIARRCRSQVDRHVGGSIETRRLSRVQAVWFSPSLAASDLGALWFRCDLVIAGRSSAFAALPQRTRGLLDRPGALDRYGTCGTTAPGADGFARVLCSAAHTWRARSTIALAPGAEYLDKPAGKAADSQCRDVAARRAADVLRLRWSFEWPTRVQWNTGQRYGLCWTPD